MRLRFGSAAVLALAVVLAGCLDKAANTCSDGTICPLEKVCIPGGCVLPEQIESCAGQPEGATCTFAGTVGRCMDGLCHGSLCGNAIVDLGEACDDGNTSSGDGCRADCAKIELCGDAIVDENEGCDDGNTNPADGCDACGRTAWSAIALLGGNANATSVGLHGPWGFARDPRGNLYVADTLDNRVQRVDTSGVVTIVAGTGIAGYNGDGRAATSAQLNRPYGVAVDGLGNLYVADTNNHRIRRVDPNGIITTVAGSGAIGGSLGDGGPAVSAALFFPHDVAVDGLGDLYIADTLNDRVRKVSTAGVIATVAGSTQGFGGDGGPATSAQLHGPTSVALDSAGRILVADTENHRIRRVADDGIITTIAGSTPCTTFCTGGFGGDGGPAASAVLNYPSGVTTDGGGTIYVADSDNHRIRAISAAGIITTVVGAGTPDFSGDGGSALAAQLELPGDVVVDPLGALYIADSNNNRIRKVASGTITTIAGSGAPGYSGDGAIATSAVLSNPQGLAVDAAGNLYIADTLFHRIRRVSPDGVITTIAGTGQPGYRSTDDGGPATQARLNGPVDVALDAAGNIYIADAANYRVRKIDTAGTITTVAGTGVSGYNGDNIPATTAELNAPNGLAIDAAGNLYISDSNNYRVRRVAPNGTITTFAGTGTAGSTGDNGAATNAKLNLPWGLAVRGGELYIVDMLNNRVRKVSTNGTITTVAGTGTAGFSGDGGNATSARLDTPRDIAFDAAGNLLIADHRNDRVRRVDTLGKISTFAGNGGFDPQGDGGTATSAAIGDTFSVAVDAAGNTFIASRLFHRVWRVQGNTIKTLAGAVDPPGMGALAQARLIDPQAFVVAAPFSIFAGGESGTVQLARAASLEVAAGRYIQQTSTAVLARFRDASFGSVDGIAYDESTNAIYLAESSANRVHAVTIVDPDNVDTWRIDPLANASGVEGFADGVAATARFRGPTGLYLDATARKLYVADTGNHVVRVIDLANGTAAATVTTLAGVPATRGFFGDGGAPGSALLFAPRALTRCANGDLFIADTGNHRVRRIAADTGLISTVVGDGLAASSGEGSPASAFPIHAPRGLACDELGNLAVTSSTTIRLLPADATGIVDGSGPVQTIYGTSPRTTFPASVTSCLTGLAIIDATTLRVADSCTGLFVELQRGPMQ